MAIAAHHASSGIQTDRSGRIRDSSPLTTTEAEAVHLLMQNDDDAAKKHCLYDPCSPFLAAISCIASAHRSPMVADSVLRDAARHTAEVVKRRSESRIAEKFQEILAWEGQSQLS